MKRIPLLFIVIALCCTGCKYFKKNPVPIIATSADTSETMYTMTDSAVSFASAEEISGGQSFQEFSSVSATPGKYYMIVGCFTVKQNADTYAEKLRNMGYDTQIIPGRDNFQMVTAKTYDSYRESVADLGKFRNDVTPNAWVYRKR